MDHERTINLRVVRSRFKGFLRYVPPILVGVALGIVSLLIPNQAHASLESSLDGIKYKLTGVILPVLSVIGVAFSAVSFFTGNPDAKKHIFYAVIGACLGFGAQAIVDFIAQTVQ
jgi:type IV secretory pathway VirB2 component (pilin)